MSIVGLKKIAGNNQFFCWLSVGKKKTVFSYSIFSLLAIKKKSQKTKLADYGHCIGGGSMA